MFEALENNPTLRERVLGMTAIGAILIGGAAGVDTMLTSGWQIGGTGGAPVVYAETSPQQYFDDVGRDWSTAPPQRVQMASQDAAFANDPTQTPSDLDGSDDGKVILASSAAPQAVQLAPNSDLQRQQDADQRFQAIESDIQQANAAIEQNATPDHQSETSAPS